MWQESKNGRCEEARAFPACGDFSIESIHFGVGGTVVFGVDGIHIGAEGIQSEFAGSICGEFASLCNPPFSTLNGLNSDFSSCYFWNS